jgi:hypothetical protein
MWLPWLDVFAELWERVWLFWACWALREHSGARDRADAQWVALTARCRAEA